MPTFWRVAKPEATSTSFATWLGILSGGLTLGLTGLNAYWSNEIQQIDAELKRRATALEEKKVEIEKLQFGLAEGRERMARLAFVQGLLPTILNEKDAAQRTLTINLINLALAEAEAQKLFAGLQASGDKRTQAVGAEGQDLIALTSLVAQMDAAAKQSRTGAVQSLIQAYRSDSRAVELALGMLEPPRIESLSASGRINVLFFLTQTTKSAWSTMPISRATGAIALMRSRDRDGVAALGAQTQESLQALERHLRAMQ